MSFKVIIPPKVDKQISALPDKLFKNVSKQILQLSQNPFPNNSLKLINTDGYRIRVGDYRILYDINSKERIITIHRVAHRKDVYKGK